MTFSIKTEREKRGITQTRAAEELEMDYRTYQRKEANESFTLKEVKKLANLMGYDLILIQNTALHNFITSITKL